MIQIAALATLLTLPLGSQTTSSADSGRSVFKTGAHIVVLDIVVDTRNGRPVTGLQKPDFLVSEDGKPQTITYFEEHAGASPSPASPIVHEPNVFTNVPHIKPSDSVTVLLLDSLNTPLADQGRVRAEVLKYLKKPQTGGRIAIFTLDSQLRLVQQLTDDPNLLRAAINGKKKGGETQNSPLLQSGAEKGADEEIVRALAEHSADMAAAMQHFLASQTSARIDLRVKLTLNAFQELARSLTGIAGRKNLVWFSGAFPIMLVPDPGLRDSLGVQRDDQAEVRKTDALLAAAQVAVYPIAAEGLTADSQFSAGADARLTTQSQLSAPREQAQERNTSHAAMEELAQNTGGAAFYNTNGLSNALERVASHGSYFYTLTYSSTNPSADGRYRKIQVDAAKHSGYQLSYRRGYYADDARTKTATAAPDITSPDPLSAFLQPGLQDSTEVAVTLRVQRGNTPATGGQSSGPGGDNPNLTGPLTRYKVDFLIPASGLQFDLDAAGHRHVRIETALVIYDRQGKPLNWIFRQLNLNLDAARYQAALKNGVNLYQEIDAPNDGSVLRGGVYDLDANLAGTLRIPLSAVLSTNPNMSLK